MSIRNLLPDSFTDLDLWGDLIDVLEVLFRDELISPIQELALLRDIDVLVDDRSQIIEINNFIGQYYQDSSIFTDDAFKRMVRYSPFFFGEKGTRSFVDFLGFSINATLNMSRLYTQDWTDFERLADGDPTGEDVLEAYEAKVWDVGNARAPHPSSHVELSYDVDNFRNAIFANIQDQVELQKALRNAFYTVSPASTVIGSFRIRSQYESDLFISATGRATIKPAPAVASPNMYVAAVGRYRLQPYCPIIATPEDGDGALARYARKACASLVTDGGQSVAQATVVSLHLATGEMMIHSSVMDAEGILHYLAESLVVGDVTTITGPLASHSALWSRMDIGASAMAGTVFSTHAAILADLSIGDGSAEAYGAHVIYASSEVTWQVDDMVGRLGFDYPLIGSLPVAESSMRSYGDFLHLPVSEMSGAASSFGGEAFVHYLAELALGAQPYYAEAELVIETEVQARITPPYERVGAVLPGAGAAMIGNGYPYYLPQADLAVGVASLSADPFSRIGSGMGVRSSAAYGYMSHDIFTMAEVVGGTSSASAQGLLLHYGESDLAAAASIFSAVGYTSVPASMPGSTSAVVGPMEHNIYLHSGLTVLPTAGESVTMGGSVDADQEMESALSVASATISLTATNLIFDPAEARARGDDTYLSGNIFLVQRTSSDMTAGASDLSGVGLIPLLATGSADAAASSMAGSVLGLNLAEVEMFTGDTSTGSPEARLVYPLGSDLVVASTDMPALLSEVINVQVDFSVSEPSVGATALLAYTAESAITAEASALSGDGRTIYTMLSEVDAGASVLDTSYDVTYFVGSDLPVESSMGGAVEVDYAIDAALSVTVSVSSTVGVDYAVAMDASIGASDMSGHAIVPIQVEAGISIAASDIEGAEMLVLSPVADLPAGASVVTPTYRVDYFLEGSSIIGTADMGGHLDYPLNMDASIGVSALGGSALHLIYNASDMSVGALDIGGSPDVIIVLEAAVIGAASSLVGHLVSPLDSDITLPGTTLSVHGNILTAMEGSMAISGASIAAPDTVITPTALTGSMLVQFTPLTLDSANSDPRGVWGNSETIWVSDESDDKIYAYDAITKARKSSEDFDTLSAAGNNEPRGIWSDGTTMWVAERDDSNDRAFAYNLSTKARDPDKDLSTPDSYLAGLWSDGTTAWIVDDYRNRVYAVTLSTGARDTTEDFDLHSDNGDPAGIWSDGTTAWIVDWGDYKMYAYNLSTKARDSSKDISTSNSSRPDGLGYDGVAMIALYSDGSMEYMPSTPTNEVRSVATYLEFATASAASAASTMAASATVPSVSSIQSSIPIEASAFGGHIDSRQQLMAAPQIGASAFDATGAVVTVTAISSAVALSTSAISGTLSTQFPLSASAAAIPPIPLQLTPENRSAQGIWNNSETIWIPDEYNDKIYAYDALTKARKSSEDFNTLSAAGNNNPEGIWSDGTTMYVVDNSDNKIYAYNMSTKARDSSKDITLDSANGAATDIWSDGTTMWVTDWNDEMVYAYDISSKARDTSKEFSPSGTFKQGIWSDGVTVWLTRHNIEAYNLASGTREADKDVAITNSGDIKGLGRVDGQWVAVRRNNIEYPEALYDPWVEFDPSAHTGEQLYGIWSDGTTVWLNDQANDRLLAFNLDDFSRDSSKDITCHSDNNTPNDIWSDGTTMWVLDYFVRKLYAYALSDGARDTSKEFNLHSDNDSPTGLWSNGTIIWVADIADDKLFAYTLSTGARNADEDFNTLSAAGNNQPFGIWSNGNTMWVIDESDRWVYAYDMISKARDETKEFGTPFEPDVIWGNDQYMWITKTGWR